MTRTAIAQWAKRTAGGAAATALFFLVCHLADAIAGRA